MLEPSEKAIENATFQSQQQLLYQQQFEEYQADKKIKKEADSHFQAFEKKDFERYIQPSKSQPKQSPSPQKKFDGIITERPIKQYTDFETLQTENLNKKIAQNQDLQLLQQEQKLLKKKLVEESRLKKKKKNIQDIEFMCKLVFEEIDKTRAGVVSKEEVFENLHTNQDAIVYFDLQPKTLWNDLHLLKTQRNQMLNFKEFSDFLVDQSFISSQNLKKELKEKQIILELCSEKPPKFEKPNENSPYVDGNCIFREEIVDEFRQIFISLDKLNDFIVKRADLIEALKESPTVQGLYTFPCSRIPVLNKMVLVSQVIYYLDHEYCSMNDELKIQNEFITWNQFYDYFRNPNPKIVKFNLNRNQKSPEISVVLLSQDHLMLIQDIFDTQTKIHSDFVATSDFILGCKKDPQIKGILKEFAREASEETGVDKESINDVFDRLLIESEEFLVWSDVLAFFSKRGRPIDLEVDQRTEQKLKLFKQERLQQNQTNSQRKNVFRPLLDDQTQVNKQNQESAQQNSLRQTEAAQTVKIENNQLAQLAQLNQKPKQESPVNYKKQFVPSQKQEGKNSKQSELDQFDKYYTEMRNRQENASLSPVRIMKPEQKTQKETTKNLEDLKNYNVDYETYAKRVLNIKDQQTEVNTITIPQPFKFEDREQTKKQTISQQKYEKMVYEIKKREEDDINYRFKAKEVPLVCKIPKLDTLEQKQKQRRDQVKEKSAQITQETQKPFSFYEKDQEKLQQKKQKLAEKIIEEKQLLKEKQFKSKEIPQECRIEMYKEMQEQEKKKREENIKKRQEELQSGVTEFNRMQGAHIQYKEKLDKLKNMKTTEEEKCTFAPKITKYVKPPENSIKSKDLQKISQNYDYLNSSNNENRLDIQSKTSSQKRIPKSVAKPSEKEEVSQQEINQEQQENDNEEQPKENVDGESLNQSKKKQTKLLKKDQLLLEKRKKEKEEQEKAKLEAEKKEQEKQERLKQKTKEFNENFQSQNNKEKEEKEKQRKQDFIQQQIQQKKNYEEQKKEMEDRVSKKNKLHEKKAHGSSTIQYYRQQAPQEIEEKSEEEQN